MEKACYKFLIVIIIIIIISYFYSEQSSARSAERSDFIIFIIFITARGLGIRQWRHRAFCVSRQHRLCRLWPSHRLWIKVYRRWITNNFPCKWHTSTTSGSKSSPRKIFHRNSSGARTPTSNSAWTTKDSRRRRQQETAEQKEHRLAQQETEEQEIGIRGIMIVHCRKPIPADICRSKSAKFQLCITARTIIIFRRTAPGQICSLFLSFSNSGRRNNAKSAYQYTVNNNTT